MIETAFATRWVTSINKNDSLSNDAESTAVEQPDRWTIKRLLDWTSDFFNQNGTDQPRLAAEILLAEAIGCERIDLYTRFDEEPNQPQRDQYRDWVRRHGEGEPVAYLVGHREFFSLKFAVNAHVLIPRPETEHLVTEVLDRVEKLESANHEIQIADIGTGSGNIAIAVAKHAPHTKIVAIDSSESALEVARENAKFHGVMDQIDFVDSDLFGGVDDAKKFDIVVCNPPYICLNEESNLDRSVVEFEPHEALFAGDAGMETIKRIVDQCEQRLVGGGCLIMEISPIIAERVRKSFDESISMTDYQIIKDLAGHQRVVVAQRR